MVPGPRPLIVWAVAVTAVALVVVFLVRWSALATLSDAVHVLLTWTAAGALSRAAIALPLVLPPARVDGLGVQASSPPTWSVVTAALIAIALAIGSTASTIGLASLSGGSSPRAISARHASRRSAPRIRALSSR